MKMTRVAFTVIVPIHLMVMGTSMFFPQFFS